LISSCRAIYETLEVRGCPSSAFRLNSNSIRNSVK
jgi:hypothetical protein